MCLAQGPKKRRICQLSKKSSIRMGWFFFKGQVYDWGWFQINWLTHPYQNYPPSNLTPGLSAKLPIYAEVCSKYISDYELYDLPVTLRCTP